MAEKQRRRRGRVVDGDRTQTRYCHKPLPVTGSSKPGSWWIISDRIKRSLVGCSRIAREGALAHAPLRRRQVSDAVGHRADVEN